MVEMPRAEYHEFLSARQPDRQTQTQTLVNLSVEFLDSDLEKPSENIEVDLEEWQWDAPSDQIASEKSKLSREGQRALSFT
jgi:hypothetical protein